MRCPSQFKKLEQSDWELIFVGERIEEWRCIKENKLLKIFFLCPRVAEN